MLKLLTNRIVVLSCLAMLVACTCGCSSKYNYTCKKEASTKLVEGKGVAISIPEDGTFNSKSYQDSGKMTANAVKKSLNKHTETIDLIPTCKAEDCFNNLAKDKYQYLFLPTINHWEERATEWTGLPDRITITLDVYDTNKEELITSQEFSGASKWFTFGGDHPQDLLSVPMKKIVNEMYE